MCVSGGRCTYLSTLTIPFSRSRVDNATTKQVENSSFTGEPEPVELCLEKTDDEALHSKNLAFNSAMVVEGKGLGVVVRTGDKTMIGSIASLAGETKAGKSTLEVRMGAASWVYVCVRTPTPWSCLVVTS